MSSGQRITSLPVASLPERLQELPNPARDAQAFVGNVMSTVMAPVDALNAGVASLTYAFVLALPKFPAARLFSDIVFGWPHAHSHPPNLIPPAPPIPLPSFGPVICAGAVSVLINGLPAARVGDLGLGVWCGGFFPIFEVTTGSSHVFIGGARPARMLIDFTAHCQPGGGFGKFGAAMMAFSAGMGALGVVSSLTAADQAMEIADSEALASDAAEAAAFAAAQGVGAAVGAMQTAADLAAAAMQAMMGKDPAIPPGIPRGNFLTGSPNVIIGGFPMPGWMSILKGLGKLLKTVTRKIQLSRPEGSRLRNALCVITGHPVEISSGRVYTSQTDFRIHGRIPIEFNRAYDTSAVGYEGPLGRGWIHPFDIHLWEDDEQGMVILRNQEVRVVGFEPIAVGDTTFNPIEKLWLEHPAERTYVVRGSDGITYHFTSVDLSGHALSEVGKSETTALRLTAIADRNDNQVRLTYEDGLLSAIEDSAGRRLIFIYTTLDSGAVRLTEVQIFFERSSQWSAKLVKYTYDAAGRLVSATDRGLVPWQYAYAEHTLIRETNPNGLSFHFEYEGQNEEARCVHTWGDDGIFERWLTYNREEKMTVVEDSVGATTTYYFNELDLPVSIVNAQGGVRQYGYGQSADLLTETDEAGRTTTYTYNEHAACTSITHPDGTIRKFTYNPDNLPVSLTDEMGAMFLREYDERGNIKATIDPLGHRREYTYDESGDLIKATDPLGGVTRFKWNKRGLLAEFTTPGGSSTKCAYDARGRLEFVTDPLGYTTRYVYDELDRLTQVERADSSKHRYEYDPVGNLISFRGANGAETRFRYRGFNKLGERTDALGFKRRFIYDTEDRLLEVQNERGEPYQFEYDTLDRVIREIGFDGCTWDYEFDPTGDLLARTDPAGRVTYLVRDLCGRVVERQRPDNTSFTFAYDPVGRLTIATGPGSDLSFTYDALGHVISESQNGQKIEHEYDALGRRIKRSSPLGKTVEFTYDADSQLTSLQTPRGSIDFKYDPAGHVVKRRLPSEVEEGWRYDECGRVIEQSLRQRRDVLFSRGYKYDLEGNLIELHDSTKGVSRFANDPVERLREVLQPHREIERFVYDSTGNLLQRGAREFHYQEPDRLTHTNNATLIYDEVGNLIEKRRLGSVIRYMYDPESRLIAVESKEGGRIEFFYDAFGRRIGKKSTDGETGFLWDGDVLLNEQCGDKSTEYVFGLKSYEPVCRFSEDSLEAYHNDHLGTPRDITDERGHVVWSASYDVYGQISQLHASQADNMLRFQGQYSDRETGLYYNRFRYYDPDVGRYTTQDPLGLGGGLNLYGYTQNPLMWVDPLGLVVQKIGRHTIGPYEEVGGHHPHQQAARRNNPNYDPLSAIAVKAGTFDHEAISVEQQILNGEARRSGQPYTLAVEEHIQRQAMKKGGFTDEEIEAILKVSRAELRKQDALEPTRTPGSKRKEC